MPPRKRVSDSPDISINLDSLQREVPDRKPFSVVVNGKRFVFRDIEDMDWKIVSLADQNPLLFISSGVEGDENREEFSELQFPLWKMRELIKAYRKHFGLPDPGESGALST